MSPLRQLPCSPAQLAQLDSRYSALLPLSVKTLNQLRLHAALNVPGAKFYQEEGSSSSALIGLQEDDLGPTPEGIHVFCEDDEAEVDRLRVMLEAHLDFGRRQFFMAAPAHAVPMIMQLCRDKGGVVDINTEDHLFALLDQADLPTEETGGADVRTLDDTHVPVVISHWKYAAVCRPDTAEILSWAFRAGLARGVFVEGQLASWVTTTRYGCLTMLGTAPAHRRKGLASACVASLSRRLLQLGITPTAYAEVDNAESYAFFTKLGFKTGMKAHFLGYSPKQT